MVVRQNILSRNLVAKARGFVATNSEYDYSIRHFVARTGEEMSTLEVFIPKTGSIVLAYWQVDYDPSERVAMIYG